MSEIKPSFCQQGYLNHAELINKMLAWDEWHYHYLCFLSMTPYKVIK
jgi:hypothetical protein